MSSRILIGDVRERLRELPDGSVHCVVTSPPYWGLRDYSADGQLGLEATPGEHVRVMVEVFREVRRVMRADGTLWLNYGDCYYSDPSGFAGTEGSAFGNGGDQKGAKAFGRRKRGSHPTLKPKDLVGMPWRLSLALQADGWYLRSDIIWAKPNPMPESVTDRPTKSHEYVFLLTKAARYYYDADAVREEHSETTLKSFAKPCQNARSYGTAGRQDSAGKVASGNFGDSDAGRGRFVDPRGRNLRDVWMIPTAPFSGVHFATFPPKLVEPCIKAGCPEGGVVLDPFGGAGTVGLVADRLGRDSILIELNPGYAEMARKRIRDDAPLFADVTVS